MKTILAIAFALALLVQDKVTLKYQPKAGDVLSTVEKISMELKLKAAGQEFDTAFRTSEKTHVTHVEVVDGRVTKKIVDKEEDVDEQKGPQDEDFQRKENALHGRKVTLTLKDGKTVIEGADDLDDNDRKKKKLKLDEGWTKWLPSKPVAVGDSWELTGDALKDAFDDEFEDGKVALTLKEVKEIDQRHCAVVTAKIAISKKGGETEPDMSMKLEGEMIVWIDRGYVVSLKGKGTVTMKKGEEDEEQFSGEGPLTLDIVTTVKEK